MLRRNKGENIGNRLKNLRKPNHPINKKPTKPFGSHHHFPLKAIPNNPIQIEFLLTPNHQHH